MSSIGELLQIATAAVARLGDAADGLRTVDDDEILALQEGISRPRSVMQAFAASIAGEIGRRSTRKLGHSGLAQRQGYVSPGALVQALGRTTRGEAVKLLRVGELMVGNPQADAGAEGEGGQPHSGIIIPTDIPARPWLASVARAVASGRLTVDGADAIHRGLGEADEAVTPDLLADAVERVLAAPQVSPEALYRVARDLGDDLDADAVAARQRGQRERRYLKVWRMDDGMVRLSALLDAEAGEAVSTAIDSVLSPRRGPRFVASDIDADGDRPSVRDTRTNDQVAVDALVQIFEIASRADETRVFATQRPAVRIVVRERDLAENTGAAVLENSGEPVPVSLVKRHLCDAGAVPIVLDDDDRVLRLGRSQRLFTTRQRIALSVRDGGCRWPSCDRPPSWCEAHHIDEWARDGGKTDVDDGMLLCRHHHLLLHDNGWRITRRQGDYLLHPPASVNAEQTPVPMPTKSRLVRKPHGERSSRSTTPTPRNRANAPSRAAS